MTARQFAWRLRTRGSSLSDWPAQEQAAAIALLRRDPDAQQALTEALAAEEATAPDRQGLRRMQAAVQRAVEPMPASVRWTGIVACAAVGLYLGIAGEPDTTTMTTPGPVPTMQATLSSTVLAAAEP